MVSYSRRHNLQSRQIQKLGPESTDRVDSLSTHYRRTLCFKNQFVDYFVRYGRSSIWRNRIPRWKLQIIGTVAVRWGRVGRLKLNSAGVNSSTSLLQYSSVCSRRRNYIASLCFTADFYLNEWITTWNCSCSLYCVLFHEILNLL